MGFQQFVRGTIDLMAMRFLSLISPEQVSKHEEPKTSEKSSLNEKWSALLAYRKTNGLCYSCGEKWLGCSHKCPTQVPIHVLQELMEMFQLDMSSDSNDSEVEPDSTTILSVQSSVVDPALS